MFIEIVIILAAISFIWALLSLRRELSKPKEIEHASRDLKRERILYRAK
jgi:hypothetical protein